MATSQENQQPDDLTPVQTELLMNYQNITGEELSTCLQSLIRHNWDLEIAVQNHLNEQEGSPSIFNTEDSSQPELSVETNASNQSITTVSRQSPHGVIGWGTFIFLFPFRFIFSTTFDILKFFYRLIRPDPRRNITDPVGDVIRFIEVFKKSYGDIHPLFFRGSYSQALNEAKKELKFLLVYLHGDEHQDTPYFCSTTLCNDIFVEFINSSVLFWACNTNSPEGYRVSRALRENTYPFLALIVLRNNQMTVVARIEGPIGSEQLIDRLRKSISDNEVSLVAARADRETRNFNQELRNKQDEAYHASLAADQEKERLKKEEQEIKEQEAQQQMNRVLEAKQKQQDIESRKELLRKEIPDEPQIDEENTVRILLKLPSGTRLERRFYRNQSLKDLYNYVFVHELAPDDFSIVTNFPRRKLPIHSSDDCSDPPTFEEAGLEKSELLFVHDNEA